MKAKAVWKELHRFNVCQLISLAWIAELLDNVLTVPLHSITKSGLEKRFRGLFDCHVASEDASLDRLIDSGVPHGYDARQTRVDWQRNASTPASTPET